MVWFVTVSLSARALTAGGCGSYDNGMTVVITAIDGMAEITVNRFYDDGIVEEDTKTVNRVPMGLVWENLPPEVYR